VRYISEASKLGKLIVIVNNDEQVGLKGSVPFQCENERAEIISAIKGVEEVIIAIDTDSSVCNTLAFLAPDIFAKGGDRTIDNIPEKEICDELGIQMVFNVGGDKVQSSSDLIRKSKIRNDKGK
jgi:D-beta-D-heptose 7-phosphate kinase/D-beta-D-heptose 1-phosphate adenosyltransferase